MKVCANFLAYYNRILIIQGVPNKSFSQVKKDICVCACVYSLSYPDKRKISY